METRKHNLLKLLQVALFVGILVLVMGSAAYAASAPDLTSATYDVSSGTMVLSGTFNGTGKATDINCSKLIIGDSKNNLVQLTAASKLSAVFTGASSSVNIALSQKDQASLANFLDKADTKGLNGGNFKLFTLAGWNGTSSITDMQGATVTVSNLPTVTKATYDYAAGKITVVGTSIVAPPADKATIKTVSTKYFAITDCASSVSVLSAGSTVSDVSKTGFTITLNKVDREGLEKCITQDSTSKYKLYLFDGWNGVASKADCTGIAFEVTGYYKPGITLDSSESLTIGSAIKAKMNKTGTLYVVAKSETISTVADLDALVTTTAATTPGVKMKAVSGTSVSLATAKLAFKTLIPTATYVIYGVDAAGVIASSTTTLTVAQKAAPISATTYTLNLGTVHGSSYVTTTATLGSTKLAVATSTTAMTATNAPALYTPVTAASGTMAYLGTNITGLSSTAKYVIIYEYDPSNSNAVTKWKCVPIVTAKIAGPQYVKVSGSAVYSSVTTTTKVILEFDDSIDKVGASDTILKGAIKFKAEASATYVTVNAATINSGKLELTLPGDTSSGKYNFTITANAIKDSAGNPNQAFIDTTKLSITMP